MTPNIIDVKYEKEVPGTHHTWVACTDIEEAINDFANKHGTIPDTIYRNIRPSGRCTIYILNPIGGQD